MLPTAYLIPAAIAWLVGGALACFYGYRMFRVVLAVFGFFLGALMASSIAGPTSTTWMLGAAFVGGLIGMALLYTAYHVGTALVGAGVGALVANLAFAAGGQDPPFLVVLLASVVGAVGSMYLQRYFIVVGTAFGGAWTMLLGGMAILGNPVARAAAISGNVWVIYPLSPAPGQGWLPYAWVILGVAGTVAQLGWTGDEKVRIRRRRKKPN